MVAGLKGDTPLSDVDHMGVTDETEVGLHIKYGDLIDGPYSEAQLRQALPSLPPGVEVWVHGSWTDIAIYLDGPAAERPPMQWIRSPDGLQPAAAQDGEAASIVPQTRGLSSSPRTWWIAGGAAASMCAVLLISASIGPPTTVANNGRPATLAAQAPRPSPSAEMGSSGTEAAVDPYVQASGVVEQTCNDYATYHLSHPRDETYVPGLVPLTGALLQTSEPYRRLSQPAADLAAAWGAIYLNAQAWNPADLEDMATTRILEDEEFALGVCAAVREA